MLFMSFPVRCRDPWPENRPESGVLHPNARVRHVGYSTPPHGIPSVGSCSSTSTCTFTFSTSDRLINTETQLRCPRGLCHTSKQPYCCVPSLLPFSLALLVAFSCPVPACLWFLAVLRIAAIAGRIGDWRPRGFSPFTLR